MPICKNCGYSTRGFKGRVDEDALGQPMGHKGEGICKACADARVSQEHSQTFQNLGVPDFGMTQFDDDELRGMGVSPYREGAGNISRPEDKIKRKFGGTGA